MTNTAANIIRYSFVSLIAFSCGADTTLSPFTSDGCSLFPDGSPLSDANWCNCCFQHDVSYWRGGTRAEREQADLKLRDCVLATTNNDALASLMYEGVRVGGSPYFQNWYRWGYGWGFDRTYQALTETESELADTLLDQYLATASFAACPI